MMMAPMAEPCQNGETPSRFRPLRIITMINVPSRVPRMEPRPPNRLAPPMTTAAMASSSRDCRPSDRPSAVARWRT